MQELMGDEKNSEFSPPLGYLLRQAAAAHRLKMDRALADLGITPPQLLVMTLIANNPGSSNADIARLASLTTPTVTVILKNLAVRGVFHTKRHRIDKRIKLLQLSKDGEVILAECRKRAVIVEKELESQLVPADINVIKKWLQSASDAEPLSDC
ncbi:MULTISPECIES: MarR family winged helix-turn-helix transcriptional regulator [Rhizobium]|uniref:MarR family transcriptional regulator n=1 Tax=Rhizobium rhododendri TaxID=2506430 RepID=A0ABY8IN96_9HYPH|nr:MULTISPECIES: MarR family transcriptional regulator [Rhizobium]WFS25067.1 MarR family transcriptional regulator [Rhizobium rhododendri]